MKRYLRIAMVILTFCAIAFILSNSLSDGGRAEAKRDFVVKLVTGSASYRKQIMAMIAKIFHMMEYAFFSFCLTESVLLLGDLSARFERVLLCGVTLALTDELIQSLLSGRGSKLTDVFVDAAGIMIGYGVSLFVARILKKWNKNKKGT